MKNFSSTFLVQSRTVSLLMAFLILLASKNSMSAVPETQDRFLIGAAGVFNTAAYKGLDGFVTPMPIFDIQYGDFFLYNADDEPVMGMEVLRGQSVTLSLAVTHGRTFLDIDEINDDRKFVYFGLEDRKRSIDVGFYAKYFGPVGLIEATLYKDISGKNGSTRASLSISRQIPDTGRQWTWVPRLFVKQYSSGFNNYYYGVTENDNIEGIAQLLADRNNTTRPSDFTTLRPAYKGENSAHLGVDLNVTYSFSKSIKIKGLFSYENFTGPLESSPLVEDKALIITSIGVAYEF